MSYIGNTPTNQNFVAGADQFNGNGSTTAFTLSRNVNTVFDIFVAISNVPQDPYNAYSVSGNTLTFTSAPPSGTGNIYVVYRATNVQTFVPTQGVSPSFGNLTYTGTLTGSTGVMNIGSGQVYKDTSGNVGIGTSSPSSNSLTLASKDIVLSDGYGPLWGTSTKAQIAGYSSGILQFFAGGSSERMRIDSSGNLLVGKTTTSSTTAGINLGANPNFIANTPSPSDGPYIQIGNIASSVASGFRYVSFRVNAGGGEVGSISTNGSSTTSYNTSSDYRLKENVQPMTGALAKVAALKPCVYTWKVDGSAGEGFIAHELQAVVPDAVTGEKDAVNEDGSIKPQGIDTSFLVATLTAAIQELNAKVEAQAAEIAALKGAA